MGNCLEKSLSDDSDENSIIENTPDLTSSQSNLDMQRNNRDESERARRSHGRRQSSRRQNSSRNMQINESSSSLVSGRHNHRHNHHHHQDSHRPFSHSLNLGFSGSSNSFMASSLPTNGISSSGFANLMSNNNNNNNDGSGSNNSSSQVYYLAPNVQRTADQLTEEEQIKLLKRMTLIQVIIFKLNFFF
jgi:hypothetical protein